MTRTRLPKCKSQLGSFCKTKRLGSICSRNESISRKADFIKVESKQLGDDQAVEPSVTSSEKEASLRIEKYDTSNPVSFRAKNRSQISRDFGSRPRSNSRYDNPQPRSSSEESRPISSCTNTSMTSTCSIQSDTDSFIEKCDTTHFRKNGYLLKKFAQLPTLDSF